MSISKKFQIFVSSTYTDLIEERQSAVEAILKAGHIPAGMELFTSSNKSQWEIIKRWIDESDIYMLILGGRYGSIELESGKSYTHLEYEYALQINKPLFAIVMKDEAIAELKAKDTEQDNPEKLKDFRNIVMSRMCAFFADEKDIKLAIHESLNDIIRENPLIGWVRGTAQSENIAQEIALLNDENRKLREENDKLKAQQVQREPKLEMVINGGQELVYEFNIPKSVLYQDREPIGEIPSHLKSFLSQETVDEYNQELKNITIKNIEDYNLIQEKIYAFENLSEKIALKLVNSGNLKATSIMVELEFPDFIYVMNVDDSSYKIVSDLKGQGWEVIPRPLYNPLTQAERSYQDSLSNNKHSLPTMDLTKNMLLAQHRHRNMEFTIPRINRHDHLIDNRRIEINLSDLLHGYSKESTNYKIIPLHKGNGAIKVFIHCEEYLKMQQFEIPITVK